MIINFSSYVAADSDQKIKKDRASATSSNGAADRDISIFKSRTHKSAIDAAVKRAKQRSW